MRGRLTALEDPNPATPTLSLSEVMCFTQSGSKRVRSGGRTIAAAMFSDSELSKKRRESGGRLDVLAAVDGERWPIVLPAEDVHARAANSKLPSRPRAME